MAPKEPTRAQLSSRLSYQSHTPNFLLKLKDRMNGIVDDDDDDDAEDFEHVADGREPIPRRPRPPIPERPEGDARSEDGELEDEKPQVVVLKEGKHLTEREAENIRRAEKGLAPLQYPDADDNVPSAENPAPSKDNSKGLSFSSSSTTTFGKSGKRKATDQLDQLKYVGTKPGTSPQKQEGRDNRSKNQAKKAKKEKKSLLSFGDDT